MSINWSKFVACDFDDEDTIQEEPTANMQAANESWQPVPPLAPLGEGSSTTIAIEQNDCRDLSKDSVPSLHDKNMFLEYWTCSLTTPQRLYTITRMWNAVPHEERPVSAIRTDAFFYLFCIFMLIIYLYLIVFVFLQIVLKTLIELISQVDERLASFVKGGHETLRDLFYHEYSSRNVTYSYQLLQEFEGLKQQEKLSTLKLIFSAASAFEKQIICSTFL